MAVTMKDVAEYTGLSLGTVSNYITGKIRVSEKKKKLINDAINTLGYKVNIAARVLKTNSYNCVGILIPSFKNIYLVRVISYIEEILNKNGYSMLVLSYHNSHEKEEELLEYLSMRVDGIVYVPNDNRVETQHLQKIQKTIPIVMFNETIDGFECDSVLVNNKNIVTDAIEILCKKGHKKIGLIAGPEMSYTTSQRVIGYKEALKKNNVEIDESLICLADYSKTEAENHCNDILDKHSDVTAIFVAGYRMTLGVLAVIKKRNLINKIAVIGYDASDIEDIIENKIGYVYQPYELVAEETSNLILQRISKDNSQYPKNIVLESVLRNTEFLKEIKEK